MFKFRFGTWHPGCNVDTPFIYSGIQTEIVLTSFAFVLVQKDLVKTLVYFIVHVRMGSGSNTYNIRTQHAQHFNVRIFVSHSLSLVLL